MTNLTPKKATSHREVLLELDDPEHIVVNRASADV
jgi:hypothetical protein